MKLRTLLGLMSFEREIKLYSGDPFTLPTIIHYEDLNFNMADSRPGFAFQFIFNIHSAVF